MATETALLTCEEIDRFQTIEALYPEWSVLWDRCADATPFQLPEWLITWWRHFGGGELFFLAIRKKEELICVAPFFIYKGAGGRRTLAIIGSGISDYLDILVEPQNSFDSAALIFEHLAAANSRWDICDLQELRPDSALLAFPFPPALYLRRSRQSLCLSVPLARTASDYYMGLQYMFRKRIRRSRRQLEKSGDLFFEAADKERLPEFLDDLFRLHGQRWHERNLPGVLWDNAIRSFHREVASSFQDRGVLRFYRMRLNGTTAAVLYAFGCKKKLYCYLSGFEQGFGHFSPGMVILNQAIEEAVRNGASSVDLLRGGEKYKYRWKVQETYNHRLVASYCGFEIESSPETEGVGV